MLSWSKKQHINSNYVNYSLRTKQSARSRRQYTVPRLYADRGVLLPFKSWYNGESIEKSNTFIFFLLHENLWCYNDLRSLLFYFELSSSEAGARDVMSCLEMHPGIQCRKFIDLISTENHIRSSENWSLWRIAFAISNQWKLITINYFHHINGRQIDNVFPCWTFAAIFILSSTSPFLKKSWDLKRWWKFDS